MDLIIFFVLRNMHKPSQLEACPFSSTSMAHDFESSPSVFCQFSTHVSIDGELSKSRAVELQEHGQASSSKGMKR